MQEFRKAVLLGFTMLLMVVFICLPRTAAAKTIMSDEEMGRVIGTSGISITFSHLSFNTQISNIYYGSSSGFKGAPNPGYVSLNNVSLVGNVAFDSPVTASVSTASPGSGALQVTNMQLNIPAATVTINQFSVGSVLLGSTPGTGKSLGSFGFTNLTARVTGNIVVQVH